MENLVSSESIQQGIDVSLWYAADNGSLGDKRQMKRTISGGSSSRTLGGWDFERESRCESEWMSGSLTDDECFNVAGPPHNRNQTSAT